MSATIEYTPEQRAAVEARGVSLSLAAGAGCGKTFVLTERFIRQLEDAEQQPGAAPISQLVAITFTDAAARELRTRIRKLVVERVKTAGTDQHKYWQQLGRAIDACRISTIHSLCGNLLREHAFDAGLDPLFTTLDAAAAAVLEVEATEDTLRRLLAERDDDAMAIATAWGIEDTKQAVAQLMSHYRNPAFDEWRQRDSSDALAAWQSFYTQEFWPRALRQLQPIAKRLLELVSRIQPRSTDERSTVDQLLDACQRIADGNAPAADVVEVKNRAVANRRPFSSSYWDSANNFEDYKAAVKEFRYIVSKLPKSDLSGTLAHEAAELGLAAARVASAVAQTYADAKTQRNALDFDDLLAKTHELLTNPAHREIQQRLRDGIDVLFVDEFQDTDRVQVDMVRALVGDVVESGKLFVVGDDKQSIYRFRGAEPQVFVDLRGQIDEQWQLPLTTNFRSQPAILNFVNALFDQVFAGDYLPLRPNRAQATPEPAVEMLWTEVPKLSEKRRGYADTRRKAEARAIAARLRYLFDQGPPIVADNNEPAGCRRANYGDVAILLRVLSNVAHYEEALRAYDIPYYLVGGHAFYTQQEIYDILHLLRVIGSECDELSLAGVLRSPMFALADETLFWLVARHKSLERGLFAGSLPGEVDTDQRARVATAAKTIRELRSKKELLQVPELLSLAMERTGYDAALLADFMGERKLANVYKLVEQARTAVASGVGTLDDFVTQLASFTTSAPKEALATTSPGTANVVQLMTVHKAKGLEFPVVVVPDVDHKPNHRGAKADFDRDLGPLVQPSKESNGGTFGLDLHRFVDRAANYAESDRLFYVACTRAADYLMLSSSVSSIDTPEGPWLKQLAKSFDLATGKWIGPAKYPTANVQASCAGPPKPLSHGAGSSTDWLKALEKAKRSPVDLEAERSAAAVAVDPTARRSFSVTRLSGQIVPTGGNWWRDDEQADDHPIDHDVDPLGFGTLVHAVLERVDLNDPASITRWSEALAPQHDVLHAAAAGSQAEQLVRQFFTTSRATELRKTTSLHRELEFSLTWPLGSHDSEGQFIQGYLDCLYLGDDNRWRVIDYKTNQVTAAGVSSLAAKYEPQMLVYGLAVEQTWGTGPAELVLHFLRPRTEIVIPWNKEARERAIELITNQLTATRSGAHHPP